MVLVFENKRQINNILQGLARGAASVRPSVSAGFLPGARYRTATSVATVAAVQEFGAVIHHASHRQGRGSAQLLPPRPFMRPAVQQNARHWAEQMRTGLRNSVRSARDVARAVYAPQQVLEQTGQAMAESIRQRIAAGTVQPDAPATIAQKHSATPLVNTGTLLSAVAVQVQL